MANINTSAIEGFDSMTPEQKVEALLNFEVPDEVDLSDYVSKSALDKKASEAANLSRQLKEERAKAQSLMSEEQRKQEALAEAAEADKAEKEALIARVAELEKGNKLREYTISFTGLGMDEKIASETATAFVDGESDKVFANLKKFLESYKKAIEAELMRKTPTPNGSGINDDGTEAGVKKARELAGNRAGTTKNFNDVMGAYLKT